MFLTAFAIFFLFLFMGVPIAFAMGFGSVIAIFAEGMNVTVVAQRMFSGVNSFSLMAIPFFMLSGELMLKGGISRRLVDFAHTLIGHITGGLGLVDILTSCIFAGISGSAAADTAPVYAPGPHCCPSSRRS
jgi:C4-dicarboxylate transporter DctM subunit